MSKRLAVFAKHSAQGVGNLAYCRQTPAAVENVRHQVVRATRCLLERSQARGVVRLGSRCSNGAQPLDLLRLELRIDLEWLQALMLLHLEFVYPHHNLPAFLDSALEFVRGILNL